VTIIELMISSALLLIVLVAVLSTFESVSTSQAFQADRSQNLDDMRGVLNRMTKDLRQATTVDAASTPSNITFTTAINGVNTPIIYTASGTTLTRKVGSAAPFTVIKNLANTDIFSYVKADPLTGIQWVGMNLQVRPARLPDTTLVLDSEVNLRNRTAAIEGSS
jgi:Tfp pilus assembly protein PilW